MPLVLRPVSSFLLTGFSLPLLFSPNLLPSVAAQEMAPPAPKTTTPQKNGLSFAKAIAASRLTRPVLVLALEGREGEKPMPEQPNATVEQVAMQFQKLARQFGWVLAIGPEKVTRLETDPGEPSPYADIPPGEACTLLMNLLTEAQRAQLMSTTGLGLSDLTTPDQKHLFQAILPAGEVKYIQIGIPGERRDAHTMENTAEKLARAKLRLGQEIQIYAQTKEESFVGVAQPETADGSKLYALISWEAYNSLDVINGVRIRSEVPNTPKQSDLNPHANSFRREIALDGLQTVADLVEKISKQSGVELYADAHYEKRKLILRVGRKTAPMSDLLFALAHCVGGTYRKVGPAYVLTDDLIGVGTRRQILCDFEELGEAMRQKPVKAAENALQANPALQKTPPPFFDDLLKPTPEQEKQSLPNRIFFGSAIESIVLPYAKLNAEQKAALDTHNQIARRHAEKDPDYAGEIIDLTRDISITRNPVVQILIPDLDGPLSIGIGGDLSRIFQPVIRRSEPDEAEKKQKILAGDGAKIWGEMNKTVAQRGLLAHPHSQDGVDRALRLAQEFNLNQLWMVVFEEGKAMVPETPFPLLPALRGQPDLLAYAIEAAKKVNITVCPVVEMFAWGSDTPSALHDHDLRGEDTLQAQARQHRILTLKTDDPKSLPPLKQTLWVDPLNVDVQKKLSGLLKKIVVYPHIGAIVWDSEMPYGYTRDDVWHPSGRLLGYNETSRLAFLRSKHLDPIDVQEQQASLAVRSNLHLEQYENYRIDRALMSQWWARNDTQIREGLRRLYTEMIVGLPEKNRPPVLLMQGQKRPSEPGTYSQFWYNEWAAPTDSMPPFAASLSEIPPESAPDARKPESTGPAKKPASFIGLSLSPYSGSLVLDRKNWPALFGLMLKYFSGSKARKWDGFVLDVDDVASSP